MLAAIDGAQKQVLFETYIWKGDEIGERSRRRWRRPPTAGSRSTASTTRSRTSSCRRGSSTSRRRSRCCATRSTPPGLRFWDLRRYGRDHRKILVVDEEVGFVGGYNIGTPYATEWRDTHVRITGPGVWDLKRAFADFWNLNRRRRIGHRERPLLLETASQWEPRIRFAPQRAAAVDVPDPVDVPRGDQPRHRQHLDDARLLPARPGLRRRAQGRRPPRGRRTPAAAAEVQPHRGRLDLARLLLASCSRRGCGSSGSATRWCTRRPSTIDGSWSTVGTANIDRLSLQGNYEINVEVIDPDMASTLEQIFLTDQAQLPRAHHRRVGGPRPAPQVHRELPRAAAAAALSRPCAAYPLALPDLRPARLRAASVDADGVGVPRVAGVAAFVLVLAVGSCRRRRPRGPSGTVALPERLAG